ncbi:MAG: NAD(P)-binding domain-containing protein, partial [Caulobacteraceae bacterium]
MSAQDLKSVGIIGAGAWGTALAQVCARAGLETLIWAREAEVADAISQAHENPLFLAGVRLEPAIAATSRLSDLADRDFVLASPPAQHFRGVLAEFAPFASGRLPIAICAKGIEQGSLALMSEVLAEILPGARCAVLSGPSFAIEVSKG